MDAFGYVIAERLSSRVQEVDPAIRHGHLPMSPQASRADVTDASTTPESLTRTCGRSSRELYVHIAHLADDLEEA